MPADNIQRRITIGCDPEFFIFNKQTNELVPAEGLIKGTKEKPYKISCGAVQVDGLSAEVNTDPCESPSQFLDKFDVVVRQLEKMIGPENKLVAAPAVFFKKKQWDSYPEHSKRLGCDPDFNAWDGRMNPAPADSETRPMRTGAGHIHLGWTSGKDLNDPSHFMDCCIVAKQLDYYVGIQSLLWDSDDNRRKLYGKAGAFRPKPYGIEYRTPSNAWTVHHRLIYHVAESSQRALHALFQGITMEEKFGDKAREIINSGDRNWRDTNFAEELVSIVGNRLFPPRIDRSEAKYQIAA